MRSGGADDISIPSPHHTSFSICICLSLTDFSLCSTVFHSCVSLFQVCSCRFSKTKLQQQLTGASAGKPQVFETKRLPHPTPTSPGNTSHQLHLFARAALVINWAGGADHVLTVLWIQVWFVVFMMRWNLEDPYRGTGLLQQQGVQHNIWYCRVCFLNSQFTSPAQNYKNTGRICMIGGHTRQYQSEKLRPFVQTIKHPE